MDQEDQQRRGEIAGFEATLRERAVDRCELCGSDGELVVREVPPAPSADVDRCVLLCERCDAPPSDREGDDKHWNCLRESIWSEIAAVQVHSYRILTQLEDQAWAAELLAEVYLDDDTRAWAEAGAVGASADDPDDGDDAPTLDSNGTRLADGDSVTIIKDLDAKGAGFVAKRGTVVKNIRLTGDAENIEGRVNKTLLVLKTKFLKKLG